MCEDDTIALWDPHTGAQLNLLHRPDRRGFLGSECVAFSPDDRSIVRGEYADVATLSIDGKLVQVQKASESTIHTLAVPPDGRRVIAGSANGVTELEPDLSTTNPTLLMVTPSGQIVDVAYVPVGGMLGADPADQGVAVGVDREGRVMAWPLRAPHRDRLGTGLAVSPNGLFISAGRANTRVVWDIATGRTLFQTSATWSDSGVFSADSRHIYFDGVGAGVLIKVDLAQARTDWSVKAHDKGSLRVAVSADDQVVATSGDAIARVWDARTGALRAALPGQSDSDVNGVAFLESVPGSDNASVKIPDPTASEIGRRLLVAPGAGLFMSEWRIGQGVRRIAVPRYLHSFAVSPDGQTLALGTGGRAIPFLDTQTLSERMTLGPIEGQIENIAWVDPGDGLGKWLASSTFKEIQVWDVASSKEQLILDRGTGLDPYKMVALPDGKQLFAAHVGRIDLAFPDALAKLDANSPAIDRAAIYARLGLWSWVKELLDRERQAGRDLPPLLAARASWMCGDQAAARRYFNQAVLANEIPQWYADACLAAGDDGRTIEPAAVSDRGPDPQSTPTTEPSDLPAGALAATDLTNLRALINTPKIAVVQGTVLQATWSKQGKRLEVLFAGSGTTRVGLVCELKEAYRAIFDKAFDGDAANAFSGKTLRVRGAVVAYSGKNADLTGWPQIVLQSPDQVQIIK